MFFSLAGINAREFGEGLQFRAQYTAIVRLWPKLCILRFEINYKLMMYYIFFISTASDSSQTFSASFLIP